MTQTITIGGQRYAAAVTDLPSYSAYVAAAAALRADPSQTPVPAWQAACAQLDVEQRACSRCMAQLRAAADADCTWIGGGTYPHRVAIKKAGGRWEGGTWVITRAEFRSANLGALGLVWGMSAAQLEEV